MVIPTVMVPSMTVVMVMMVVPVIVVMFMAMLVFVAAMSAVTTTVSTTSVASPAPGVTDSGCEKRSNDDEGENGNAEVHGEEF